jgi:hypothetical protein
MKVAPRSVLPRRRRGRRRRTARDVARSGRVRVLPRSSAVRASTAGARHDSLQSFPIGGGMHGCCCRCPTARGMLRVRAMSTSRSCPRARSSEHRARRPTVEVAYCPLPTRYLWDWARSICARCETLHGPVRATARGCARPIAGGGQVDRWIANSSAVAERIARFYGRDSGRPAIDVASYEARTGAATLSSSDVSRRTSAPTWRCALSGHRRLIVVGEGRERDSSRRSRATPSRSRWTRTRSGSSRRARPGFPGGGRL